MGSPYGELVFAVDNNPPQGFTNTDANRDQVKDEIVIRELLQNALDSGTGTRAVRFVLDEVAASRIFGLDRYREAFEHACRYLAEDEPPTGKQMIKRIHRALNRDSLRCLFCYDDGNGIAEAELRSLYGSGRSTKRAAGRGSVGHGHLTSFVPSDLRYVLYAGRHAGADGDMSETFGGHAIVASHIVTASNGTTQRSADGFIRQRRARGQEVLFDYERGGTRIPRILAKRMGEGSGSAVMIAAYKPVAPNVKPEQLILAAAARHFLVAIFDGTLNVTFEDSAGSRRSLTPETLAVQVETISPNRSRTASRRTLRTIQDPTSRIPDEQTEEALGPGARVWIRPRLRSDEAASHRVSMFRDGMWIQDNTVNYLQPRHFAGVDPFDAVVDLDSDRPGGMGKLVRDAEGASHLQITPSELDNPSELVARLSALRELLSASAHPVSQGEPYAPPQLRLTGSDINAAIPKRRPRRPDSDEHNVDDLEREQQIANGEPELPPAPVPGLPDPHPPEPGPLPESDTEKTDQTVKAGNSTGLSMSCRPDPEDPCLFHVCWYAAGRGFRSGAADLSLAVPSGTDQTSRHRITPQYLTIVSVRHQQRSVDVPAGGTKQVRIPRPNVEDSAEVRVARAAASAIGTDRGLVEAVLFRRSASSSRGNG